MNWYIRKNIIFYALLLTSAAFISYLSSSYLINIILATIVFFIVIWIANENSPIHLMFIIGFSTFIYFPSLVNGYISNANFNFYYASAFVSSIFLYLTKSIVYQHQKKIKLVYRYSFVAVSVILAITSFLGDYALYLLSPFVMFYSLNLKRHAILYNISISLIFITVFTIYMNFGWSGFGRTVTFGIMITGLIYFLYANEIKINKIIFSLASILGSLTIVSRKNFNLNINLNDATNDSAIGPYLLASKFIDHYTTNGLDVPGFINQTIFAIFTFVPREIWPTKPYGFGFQYVVENMDQYLIDAGHSIASTLIGDHIYYLGWWGLITATLMVVIIARMCRLVYNSKLFNGFGIVIFSCNMMVLVWGGMTSFSARIAFPLVSLMPFAIIYLYKNLVLRKLNSSKIHNISYQQSTLD